MITSIGLLELSSISAGIEVCDGMLKASAVKLALSRTICSGKYLVMVYGDVGDVKASLEVGIDLAGTFLIEYFMIPNVHPEILSAIRGNNEIEKPDALGIVESFSCAALIEGADVARKAADVKIVEIRIAMALGGKAFAVLTGSVADVESAVAAATELIGSQGLLVNKVVIPRPSPDLIIEMI